MDDRREGTLVAVSLTPADWLEVRIALHGRTLELHHLIRENAASEFVSGWESDLARVCAVLEAISRQRA